MRPQLIMLGLILTMIAQANHSGRDVAVVVNAACLMLRYQN
jgi:hypothetical protein